MSRRTNVTRSTFSTVSLATDNNSRFSNSHTAAPDELGPELPKLRNSPYGWTVSSLISLVLLLTLMYVSSFIDLCMPGLKPCDLIIPLLYTILTYPIAQWIHGASENKVILMNLKGRRLPQSSILSLYSHIVRGVLRLLGSYHGIFWFHLPFVATWWVYQIQRYFLYARKSRTGATNTANCS